MFAKNAGKRKNFAPLLHSVTKNRVIGLENSGVECVLILFSPGRSFVGLSKNFRSPGWLETFSFRL
jgi:hypothetical protein